MNDYERYDFWHRETVQVKKDERTMARLVESARKFDEKTKSQGARGEEIRYPDPYYYINII